MIRRRTLLGLGALGLVAACGADDTPPVTGPSKGPWHGTHLDGGGAPLPDVTLTDQHGNTLIFD